MTPRSASALRANRPPQAGKALVAASIGNFVEWYDFAIYGYTATVIAEVFFPETSTAASLLAALAVFGVTFLLRPVGGIVLGRLGDRIGRRPVLSLTVLLMGVATALMGLLPSYDAIGLAAPILLVVLRLAQGFFAGGEFSGASTYLVEYAPRNRRGLWATLSMATGVVPFGVAGFVVLAVSSSMSSAPYLSYGWRLPFLFSLPLALAGLYLRLRIEETPVYRQIEKAGKVEQRPMLTVLRRYPRAVFIVFGIASLNAVAAYTLLGYMPTFLVTYAEMARNAALVASSVAAIVLASILPFVGRLGDTFGRRVCIRVGTVGIILLAVPGYLIMGQGSIATAILGALLIIIPASGVAATLGPAMCEIFPTRMRYSGSAFGYNIAYALFGGTAPFIAGYLVSRTGTALAPAFYLVLFGLICLAVAFGLPETSMMSLTDEHETPDRTTPQTD